MKRLCAAILFLVAVSPLAAYGEPQKPAPPPPSTRANKAQAEVSKSGHDTSNAIIKHLAGRTSKPSKRPHGKLGGASADSSVAAPKKTAQSPTSTRAIKLNAGGVNPIVISRDRSAKADRPSNKTHGVLGGGLLDQGSGLNQSGPASAGSTATSGAPTSRGQVIK
jgi:hypothetical protein